MIDAAGIERTANPADERSRACAAQPTLCQDGFIRATLDRKDDRLPSGEFQSALSSLSEPAALIRAAVEPDLPFELRRAAPEMTGPIPEPA